MAYKIKDPKLAQLAKKHRAGKKSAKKKARKASKKRAKRRQAPASMRHIPVRLLEQLGYAKPRKRSVKKTSKSAKKKTTTKRATKRKAKKKTAAELHAFRVKQGKRLAAMRKKQTHKKRRAKNSIKVERI